MTHSVEKRTRRPVVSVGGSSSAGLIFFNASTTAVGLTKWNPRVAAARAVSPPRPAPGARVWGQIGACPVKARSYSLWAVIVAEIVLTGVCLPVILGSTDDRAPKGFAGLAIGLTLTLIHLICIPMSNTSVNPARSTGVAFVNANGAPAQLWVFWLAPLIGAAIAGIAYPYLFGRHEELADRPVRDDALEADDDSGQHRAGRP